MKKCINIILICILLTSNIILICILLNLCIGSISEQKGRYEYYGKDALEYFGNGRFVVFYPIDDNFYDLYDRRNNGGIDNIEKYTDIYPFLYTIGKKGYTKINYELGLYHQSNSLEKFDENDEEIFKLLDNSSDKIRYKDSHNRMERDNDKKGPIVYLDNDGLFVVYEKESNDPDYELVNRKDMKVIDYIDKYKIFESCIYTIGKQGYTKINLLNDKESFKQFDDLENFNDEDQIVFKVLDSEDSNLKY